MAESNTPVRPLDDLGQCHTISLLLAQQLNDACGKFDVAQLIELHWMLADGPAAQLLELLASVGDRLAYMNPSPIVLLGRRHRSHHAAVHEGARSLLEMYPPLTHAYEYLRRAAADDLVGRDAFDHFWFRRAAAACVGADVSFDEWTADGRRWGEFYRRHVRSTAIAGFRAMMPATGRAWAELEEAHRRRATLAYDWLLGRLDEEYAAATVVRQPPPVLSDKHKAVLKVYRSRPGQELGYKDVLAQVPGLNRTSFSTHYMPKLVRHCGVMKTKKRGGYVYPPSD